MTGRHVALSLRVAVALACVSGWILTACARELPPPGTPPDLVPPTIVSIRPAPDSVVVGFDGSIEIRFDEPVNFPNDIARQVFASPMEDYEVEEGFSSFRLKPRAGWRDSVVYCFTVPADGISDLLRNRMEGETSFCFSNGPEITDTRVTGTIIDGVTRLPQNEARVVFLAPGDSTPYGALSDTDGAFSARALPPGEYQAFGFVDQNRNYTLDREIESHDSVTFVATVGVVHEFDFAIVAPDTTAPLLLRAETTDSFTVQVEFDDYLINPPEIEPIVSLRDSISGTAIEILAVRIGGVTEVDLPLPDTTPEGVGLPEDSAAVVDSVGQVDPEVPSEADSTLAVEQDPLPSRFVSFRVATPLDSVIYSVSVQGVVNLRDLVGGGDTTFVAEPPPPPEADTREAPADTTVVAADTTEVAADTTEAVVDTTGVSGDTLDVRQERPRIASRRRSGRDRLAALRPRGLFG